MIPHQGVFINGIPTVKMSHCRLCRTLYPVNEKGKKIPSFTTFNIFNKRSSEQSIKERILLSDVGNVTNTSPSICRPCERGIKIIEQAEEFKRKWGLLPDPTPHNKRKQSEAIESGQQKKKARKEVPESMVKITSLFL